MCVLAHVPGTVSARQAKCAEVGRVASAVLVGRPRPGRHGRTQSVRVVAVHEGQDQIIHPSRMTRGTTQHSGVWRGHSCGRRGRGRGLCGSGTSMRKCGRG